MTELIHTELKDRILTIRITRLDKKNALTQAMYADMASALQRAAEDPQVRVVLFAGSTDCFSAGNDMVDFLKPQPAGQEPPVIRFMKQLSTLQKPVIAAVNGVAIGIGVTLLLHCDLVFAGNNARFQLPFVNIGICPEFCSSLLMPLMMGHVRASELLMLGEFFDANTAREYGLVNRVSAPEESEAQALEAARRLVGQPPAALRTCKALLKRSNSAALQDVLMLEMNKVNGMLKQPEALEVIGSFVQKRKPDFSKFE